VTGSNIGGVSGVSLAALLRSVSKHVMMKLPSFIGYFAAALLSTVVAHAASDFKTEIYPLIETHCLKCHSATHEVNGKVLKPKGGIRLDAAWAMLKGNDDVVPVKPKDVENSDLLRVVTLPRDDDKAMPPENKGDPLTAAEIATLKTWIAEGADFGGWEGNLEGKPAAATVAAKVPVKERERELFYAKLAEGLRPPVAELLAKAQAGGARVAPVSPDSPLLRVDFLTGVSQCNDQAVAALAPLADHIAHLDLARTNITDAALKDVARMRRLTRLDLRSVKITDTGIVQLAALENLTFLNLYGIPVTDEAVTALGKMKSLRNICLAETMITEAGKNKLQAALPLAQIVFNPDLTVPAGKGAAKKAGN